MTGRMSFVCARPVSGAECLIQAVIMHGSIGMLVLVIKPMKIWQNSFGHRTHGVANSCGSPRITADLRAEGLKCSKNRVARVMRDKKIVAKRRKRFKVTTDSKHEMPVAPNLVKQNFVAERPHTLWTSDITYIWTREGWLYLAVVLDVCTRKIVGWSASHRMTVAIIIDALSKALAKRAVKSKTILHSDRGRQYVSHELEPIYKKHDLVASHGIHGQLL
ncbi:MAG: IS3 family transposase [Acidobacteriota bacterium]